MGEGERPAPDYRKIVADLTHRPGEDEGVTPEMDQRRADHQLPDSDADFSELEKVLDRIGVEHFTVSPPDAAIVDRNPNVIAAEVVMTKEKMADDAELLSSEQTETFDEVVDQVRKLGLNLNNDIDRAKKILEKRESDSGRLPELQTVLNDVVDVARQVVELQRRSKAEPSMTEHQIRDIMLAHSRRLSEIRDSFDQHFGDLLRQL